MFRTGDKVIFNPRRIKATVIKRHQDGDYLVEFDDKNLIPPQMTVPSFSLSPDDIDVDDDFFFDYWSKSENGPTNKSTHCPKCGTKWKETIISHKAYYDCLKCNIKKEDV